MEEEAARDLVLLTLVRGKLLLFLLDQQRSAGGEGQTGGSEPENASSDVGDLDNRSRRRLIGAFDKEHTKGSLPSSASTPQPQPPQSDDIPAHLRSKITFGQVATRALKQAADGLCICIRRIKTKDASPSTTRRPASLGLSRRGSSNANENPAPSTRADHDDLFENCPSARPRMTPRIFSGFAMQLWGTTT